MRTFARALIVLLAAAVAAPALAETPRWPEETVRLFATLPVQEGGRVKPLDTLARFTLLRLNGMRVLKAETPEGRLRLSATEWLLDVFFRPELAETYRCFSVETGEVVAALGGAAHTKKRDRYSYAELAPHREKLMELARKYAELPAEKRGWMEAQIVSLGEAVLLFENLTGAFAALRRPHRFPADSVFAAAFPEAGGVPLSVVLTRMPGVLGEMQARRAGMSEEEARRTAVEAESFFTALERDLAGAWSLALFPPPGKEESAWRSLAEVAASAFQPDGPPYAEDPLLLMLEQLAAAPPASAAFTEAARAFHGMSSGRATARGEYRRVPLEHFFYRTQFLFYSQWLFVLAFLAWALTWAAPGSVWMRRGALLSLLPPLALLAAGITLRCVIRGRPPVTTLYETVLFTALVAVCTAIVVELVNRQRIAGTLGALAGAAGLFFAYRYEAREAVDTMPAVVAVLDTNFWLATHVTTIVAGYGAGLFAALLAHVWILGKLLRLRRGDAAFYAGVSRAVYGVLCFCLLFSVIGTVLGGVWAAQSWGRFWGWDPKENGALMIVLWGLVLLHARRGGHLRDRGMAAGAVLMGVIVVFSWWGVNALGVGLHSYGFTQGIWRNLFLFWGAQALVTLAAFAPWTADPGPKQP